MIRLTTAQAWETLAAAHTGILTTLRRDGAPVTLPVWFVTEQRTITFKTPSATAKVTRIRRDARASFLVESGHHWGELRGVHLSGRVEVIENPEAMTRIDDALAVKYAHYRPATASLPGRVQARYSQPVFLRFVPEGRVLTWDNAKIVPNTCNRR